jgi:hypothetical protein
MQHLNTDEQRETIAAMFETLWVDATQYGPRMENLLGMLDQGFQNQQHGQSLSNEQIGAVFAMSRLLALEHQWRAMKTKQEEIVKPIADFLAALNRLFRRTVMSRNEENELVAALDNETLLDLKDLSSGEKQLIILFGEALMQEGSPSVYLTACSLAGAAC